MTFLSGLKKEIPEIGEDVENLFKKITPDKKFSSLLQEIYKSKTFKGTPFKEFVDGLDATQKRTLTAGEALSQYKTHLESVGKTTSVIAKAMSGLKSISGTILSTAGNMVAGALIAEAISLAIKGIYNIIKADEIAIEKGEEASQAIKETFDSLVHFTTYIHNLYNGIDSLPFY